MNPDLLNPSDSKLDMRVVATAAITKPLPTTKVTAKSYYCTVPSASMHRNDGKKLPFVFGFCRQIFWKINSILR
jgi:hypothetical protein